MQRDLNLLFFLRGNQNKQDEFSTIYLRMTINGERAELSTKRKIESNDWDSIRQRAKGRSEKSRTLNEYLDNMENQVKKNFNVLINDEQAVTVFTLRDMLTGKFQKSYTLIKLFEMNNKLIEKEKGTKYVKSTIDQYTVTLTRLIQFLKDEYDCDDLDLDK